jgi:hypothetical protein
MVPEKKGEDKEVWPSACLSTLSWLPRRKRRERRERKRRGENGWPFAEGHCHVSRRMNHSR